MPQATPTTKADLLERARSHSAALHRALARLTPAQWTDSRDAEGWDVLKHVIHLERWERSALYFIQGRGRHEALGVTEEIFLKGPADAINAAMFRQSHQLSPDAALAALRHTHDRVLEAVSPLSDADLQLPYRHYLPDEAGPGPGPPALAVIDGNCGAHYAEHLAWIEALVRGDGGSERASPR